MFSSEEERQREAKPERRTGKAYRAWTFKAAAGLLLWFLASPAGRTENNALECEEIRPRM